MSAPERRILDCDVVVLGSGAAALSAALKAAAGGLSVVVLEKSDKLGGTSAMSGAGAWIPANHHALAAGVKDDADQAMDYIRAVSPPAWREREEPLWEAFVQAAPRMLAFVEANTPIRFGLLSEPDLVLEAPGGKKYGRMLSPLPLKRSLAGPWAGKLRRSTQPHSLTYEEMIWANFVHKPVKAYLKHGPKILWRKLTGQVSQGGALMTGLVRGCLDKGCRIFAGARATGLVTDSLGAVTEVLADGKRENLRVRARRGVVIATGGFEWDPELYAEHFPQPLDFLCSPRTNTGDGQRMAKAVGAELAHMDQANIAGAMPTRYEGRVHGVPLRFQASRHAIVVDAAGRRFGNEFDFNFGEKLLERDPVTGAYPHLPAWVIGDSRFLAHMPIVAAFAHNKRGWLVKAPTLDALAKRIGLPAEALAQTVARFNGFAEKGVDEDFGRGASGFDRLISGRRGALAVLDDAPFCAMPFNVSLMGTKGGPRTNAKGQVLRPGGEIIPGLYAAGNAMANPFGTRAVGAGTTIGPVMTWGFICAESLLADNRAGEAGQ